MSEASRSIGHWNRLHSMPVSREQLAAGNVYGKPLVMGPSHRHAAFTCVRCSSPVSGAAPFCDLHLWTFDHPVLRDAPIFQA